MKSKKYINRRNFISQMGCGALATTTLFNTIANLGMTNSLVAAPAKKLAGSEYRAMVCILLAGGNDSFNMLVPRSQDAYNQYAGVRSNLALAHGSLLPLDFEDAQNRSFGVHPSMPEVQQLFNSGNLAFLSNVGSLVENTSKSQYIAKSTRLPLGLLSHADQIQHWQTSIPHERNARGWAGRMADILQSGNSNEDISMNISLSGTNVFQQGNTAVEYAIRAKNNGSVGIDIYEGQNWWQQVLKTGMKGIFDQQYDDVFKQTYRDKITHSQSSHEVFDSILSSSSLSTNFSDNQLSSQMKMIARTIAKREELGMSRQTFFVNFGGWDHHDGLLNAQVTKLSILSKALNEFNTAMQELQVSDKVTTFTISDFGRTLTSNGDGTDHAWGGNAMIMGGSVKGKSIYGRYPSLALNGADDVGGAIMLPSTSADEYFAELARWFGVTNSDLEYVLPNINNFYDTGSNLAPIGFMNQ